MHFNINKKRFVYQFIIILSFFFVSCTYQESFDNNAIINGINLLMAGGILAISLYHFGLFITRKEDLSALYFAIFVFLVFLYALLSNSIIAAYSSFNIDSVAIYKSKYFSLHLGIIFFIFFIKELFDNAISKKFIRLALITTLIFAVSIILITDIELAKNTILIWKILVILSSSYIIYIFINSKDHDRKKSGILLIGGAIVFIAFINDLLLTNNILKTIELSYISIFLFVLCQSFIISVRYARSYKRSIDLSEKLEHNKHNLEKIVEKRTTQLLASNKEIRQQWQKLKETNNKLEQQKQFLKKQREELESINSLLEMEKEKTDKLLYNILPTDIAEELRTQGIAKTRNFSNVSVLFTDFEDFSEISQNLDPDELVKELHYCFSSFDDILNKYQIHKIKTIGDAYMCAGGLTSNPGNWAAATVLSALEIREFMIKYKENRERINKSYFKVRIGIHSGPVISGVVGKSKFAFDIWGNTVNTASFMESACEPGMVNVSYDIYKQIKRFFECESRGKLSVKHQTDLEMFYVNRIKYDFSDDEQGIKPNKLMLEKCKLKLRFDY